MNKALVIGYGNPLREDDALGWIVADEIHNLYSNNEIEVMTSHQLTPEMVIPISKAKLVLFVDVSISLKPGEMAVEKIKIPDSEIHETTSHSFSSESLLKLCHHYYSSTPDCYLLSIGGESFGLSEQVTPVVKNAIPQLIQNIGELLREYRYIEEV